jgi:plastocyanin
LWPLVLIVVVPAVLLVAGCGSSGGAAPPSAATSPPDTSSAAPAPVSVEIAETDQGFEPKSITVQRGQTVHLTFVNKGKDMHNLRVAGGAQFTSAGDLVLGNPVVMPGQSATGEWQAPSQAGRRLFRCDVHPNHTGVITIR